MRAVNELGTELSYQWDTGKNWHIDFNQTLYSSKRGLEAGQLTSGRYDGGYASHISISHDVFGEKKNKNRIWNFALRGIVNGGLRETAIDTALSRVDRTTIALYPGIFDQQLPAFKRIDLGITRTVATARVRWRYSLDIQNLFGLTNIAYHYYDPYLKRSWIRITWDLSPFSPFRPPGNPFE